MSELKAVHAFDVYEAYTKTGDDDAAQVYLKSEADKVIAEKDKEIRRQKYKRCLDKANYWVSISYHCIDDKHRQRAEKHHRKWLDIAKRFEEAK